MLGKIFVAALLVACCILIEVESDDGLKLECHGHGMFVSITDKFLEDHNVEVLFPNQIYFGEHANCSSVRREGSYQLIIPAPFDQCGTVLEHDTGSYVYKNEIVIYPHDDQESGGAETTKIERGINRIPIQCSYDDSYVVSSEFGLKPYVRTLYFETGQGNISVDMNLYQRKSFHPKSRLGARPMVLVGFPLYVSVKTDNIFGDPRIATTLEQCYATTQPDFKRMDTDRVHYLLQGRCASPDDATVEIYRNGAGEEAQFKFDMFKWRSAQVEFVYLHCEVRVCNTSLEQCGGDGAQCDGSGRVRMRRNAVDQNESGMTSLGPIRVGRIQGDGEARIDAGHVGSVTRDKAFLEMYIYLGVGVVLLILIVVINACLIVKRSRQRKSLHMKTHSSTTTTSSIDSDSFNQNHLPMCYG